MATQQGRGARGVGSGLSCPGCGGSQKEARSGSSSPERGVQRPRGTALQATSPPSQTGAPLAATAAHLGRRLAVVAGDTCTSSKPSPRFCAGTAEACVRGTSPSCTGSGCGHPGRLSHGRCRQPFWLHPALTQDVGEQARGLGVLQCTDNGSLCRSVGYFD